MRALRVLFAVVSVLGAGASLAQERAEPPVLSLDGGRHSGLVKVLAFSPDGRELYSAGYDKAVRVWDLATGEAVRTLRGQVGPGPEGRFYAGALSPDGRVLAVAGYGTPAGTPHVGDIRLLDPRTGAVKHVLPGHEKGIAALAFSADGRFLASGSADGTARVWNVSDGTAARRVPAHGDVVSGLDFSPDGVSLVTVSRDGTARIWSVEGGPRSLPGPAGPAVPLTCVSWSRDGRIAAGAHDGTIRLWDAAQARLERALPAQEKGVTAVAFSPDGRTLASSTGGTRSGPNLVRLWDPASGRQLRAVREHDDTITALAWSPDGRHLASAGGNRYDILITNPQVGRVRRRLTGLVGGLRTIRWSADGSSVAWASASGPAPVELEGGFNLAAMQPVPGSLSAVTWVVPTANAAERSAVPGPEPNQVTLTGPGQAIPISLTKPGDEVRSIALTRQGVVVGSVFSLALYGWNGARVREFTGGPGEYRATAVAPDGRYVACAAEDGTVRIWPLSGGAAVPVLVSLLPASRTAWVAWTGAGYYTSSPAGDQLVGWHVNRGRERAADFYGVHQFRRVFYRPDVLRQVLPAGSVEAALAKAGGAGPGKGDLQIQQVGQFAPPEVEILAPADKAVVTTRSVTLRARIREPNGRRLSEVRMLVNARPTGDRDLGKANLVEWQGNVSLAPGRNVLTVVATNDAGVESAPASVAVEYRLPQAGPQKPSLYVLSVGVSEYRMRGFNLRFAAKDAADLASALEAQQGRTFDRVATRILTNDKANKTDIVAGLQWLRGSVTPRDWAVLFIAGHGFTDERNQYYFAPHEVDPDQFEKTALVWKEFKSTLEAMPGKVLLILDTCYAAGASLERLQRPTGLDTVIREAISNEMGLVTMAACLPHERSQEGSDWQNGAFTKALVEALRGTGNADADQDGEVTLAELDAYVSNRVKKLTSDRQHPTVEKPVTIPSSLTVARVK